MAEHLTPAEALAALEHFYEEFYENATALDKKSSVRDALSNFLGSGPKKRAQGVLIEEAIPALRERVNDLLAALEDCAEEARGQYLARGIERMLIRKPDPNKTLEFMLIALEGQAEPLILAADGPARAELARRYQKCTPKRLMFPAQLKLLQQMETRAN